MSSVIRFVSNPVTRRSRLNVRRDEWEAQYKWHHSLSAGLGEGPTSMSLV